MRHTPTALYVDTEFFKRRDLRFDTAVFTEFKDAIVPKGLRLLVPEIMEQELLRHFNRRAGEAAAQIRKAHENYPANKLTLVELPSEKEIESECLYEMNRQWSEFKEHFVVENLPIVGNLEDVVDWYFSVLPPFSEKKPKEFPDAFILSALDQYHEEHHANISVISADNDFIHACSRRRYLSCFNCLQEYTKALQPKLSAIENLPGDFDPTKPITTEDLRELKTILARGSEVTPIEIDRVINLLNDRGSNYDYFFQNAADPVWLGHLDERGFFLNPPDSRQTAKEYIDAPWWPPLDYLIRIFEVEPEAVENIISVLPDTNNFRVLEGIFRIVLKADTADAVSRLSRFITSYVEHSPLDGEPVIGLLKKPFVFDSQLSEFTLGLLLKIVEFQSDPHEQEKRNRHNEYPDAWDTILEPAPRFDESEYRKILGHGVRPLADRESYQVARILIDAVAGMIRLSMHQDQFGKGVDWDGSEIWCRRLNQSDPEHQDIRGTLVQTLTYACERVYLKAPHSIDALDQALRNHGWEVFLRLRQHLYASFPNDRTFTWIRQQILGHNRYSRWGHHYEFQMMIRKASEQFGYRLLSEDEQKKIFDEILSGPPGDNYRERIGEDYSNEEWKKRQRDFHRMQLRPFASILTGERRSYYESLAADSSTETITDEDYLPFSVESPDFVSVSYRSPISAEDIEILTDEELISYLNEFEQEHLDANNINIEINIEALAEVFQALFKKQIANDEERLAFWMTNRGRIERPIHVNAMLKAILDLAGEGNLANLAQWIEFCAWVLSHSDVARVEGQPEPRGESRGHPDWSGARRTVVDFVESCVSRDNEVSITERNGLGELLRLVCNQFDSRLDQNRPVLLSEDDPVTEAINNTRSRALQSLVRFGFWIRRHLPEEPLSDVTGTLTQRLVDNAEIQLTRPERAMLGMQFGNLCSLVPIWATEHRDRIFPQKNKRIWQDAFGAYIRFNRPVEATFHILRDKYSYSVEVLDARSAQKDYGRMYVERLGQHLFIYYLWGVYPLSGNESLMARFYAKTENDRERWGQLFHYVGSSLSKGAGNLENDLTDRIHAFFDWRLEVSDPTVLNAFTFWLEAECLDPDWRLQSYLKVLDLDPGPGNNMMIYRQVKALNDFHPDHLASVVECLVKITSFLSRDIQIHLPIDETRAILQSGLNAEDPDIQKSAEQARENLLRSGYLRFLEIDH